MNNFNAFLEQLEEEVGRLPHSYQLAFSGSCCERAFPSYTRFFDQSGWGNPSTLRLTLDRIWNCVQGYPLPANEAMKIEEACKALAPDSEEFSSWEATAAQEAALMVVLLVQFTYDRRASYPVRIATFNRDTIDMVVQIREGLNPSDPALENKIAQHSLMRAELSKQKSDLMYLLDEQTPNRLRDFENRARLIGKDNLGI